MSAFDPWPTTPTPVKHVRAGTGMTASAPGADGTLVDLAPLSTAGALTLLRPGDLITCVFNGSDPSQDYTPYFHAAIVDHSGTPALSQNQALPGGVQNQGCAVLGLAP